MSVHTRTRHISRPSRRITKIRRPRLKKAIARDRKIPWREAAKKNIRKYSEGGLMLRGSRFKNEVSQKELADALGVSQHHISEMENGKRPIGKEMAKRLADFFKTDYRVFL